MSTHAERVHAYPVEGKTFGPVADVPRVQQGALNLVDIATSTMANIAPAMTFSLTFALIAAVAGLATPLTIAVATIALALLGNTLAEFSRSIPSTGSFITFTGKTFGPVMAITTTLVVSLGYIIAMASVVDISGGWPQIILQHYLHITVPWQPLTLIYTASVFYLMVRGVNLSTRWAGFLFLLEMGVLVVVSVIALVTNAAHLSLAPFNPANIKGGLAGLGLGFPVAVYMFIGWENSAALAEETNDPRRNVPKAIYASLALMAASYLLFAYATVVAFHDNTAALAAAQVPFISAAQAIGGVLALLAYLQGFTSTWGPMFAGSNSKAGPSFNTPREGCP